MDNKEKKKVDYWVIAIFLIPVFVTGMFAEVMLNFEGESFVKVGAGRAFGAAIGALVYFLTLKKRNWLKITLTVLSIGLSYLTVLLLSMVLNINFLTCEICGYKAVREKESQCSLCEVDLFEESSMKPQYISKDSWLIYEQLDWFEYHDEDGFDFYKPKKEEGFKKDMNWQPSITKEQLFDKSN